MSGAAWRSPTRVVKGTAPFHARRASEGRGLLAIAGARASAGLSVMRAWDGRRRVGELRRGRPDGVEVMDGTVRRGKVGERYEARGSVGDVHTGGDVLKPVVVDAPCEAHLHWWPHACAARAAAAARRILQLLGFIIWSQCTIRDGRPS